MGLKFAFNSAKALEALAYVANAKPGLSPLYVAKIFFYAEKWHLNRYGRPIIADTYIAMQRGPVPSTIKNYIDRKWNWVGKPDGFDEAVQFDDTANYSKLYPGKRAPRLEFLSGSDIECLDEAIAFCSDKSFDELSVLTHEERAWLAAEEDRPMQYELFIDEDNEHKESVLQSARDFASRGIL